MMTRLELVRAITTAYWDAVLAQAARAQDDENVAHAEAMLAAATKQVELGHEPATHTMKAEVELARTRQQAIRTQAAVTQAKTALNAAMGRDPALPVVVPAALNFAPTTLDEVALLDRALARRPEIAVALADVEAARGGLALARLASRPDAAVQVRQERFGRGAAIGVAVALPLLDWGSARSGIQRTQATITASERRLEAVRAGVRFDVATALAALHSTDAQVRALQGPALMQAEKLAELAMTGYREGATNYLEVLEARRTLRAVKSEYLAALAEHRKALAQVAWATGADTPPVVKEVLP
jgi:outer membrane protein TolC